MKLQRIVLLLSLAIEVLSTPLHSFTRRNESIDQPSDKKHEGTPLPARKAHGNHDDECDDGDEDCNDEDVEWQYLTSKTLPYLIKGMPEVAFDIGEMYSGLMPINRRDPSRSLFFVFQPNTHNPDDEALTIWLNGGPGCSSLEGFFQENGKFVWREGQEKPSINQYAWTNLTNMLWVEQPVGTGYTQGDITAVSEEETALDFLGFFKNFQRTFGIKEYEIYVTGESYAGRYVPYISAAMLDEDDQEYFNVKGALMYNACIGQYDYVQEQVPVAPFVRDNNEFYNFSPELLDNLTASHEACGYQNFIDTYLTFPPSDVQPPLDTYPPQCDIWGRVFRELDRSTDPAVKCFNPYQISEQCPLFPDVLGRPSNFSATPYFNRTDVKRAFNVPDTISWTECSNNDVFVGPKVGGPEGGRDISIDPIQRVLPQVVEATQNVIVSNGNYDMIIITNGTLLSIQNMTWADQLGFQREPRREILLENGEVGGIQHYERGLMWAETYKVGHMGPEFSPYISYRQMQWLLGGIKHL